jgi:non-ribosomal peptide synthetase component E (peptide arylation enzyme)
MNISLLFFNAAKAHPKRLAIIDKKRSINYETLAQEVLEKSAYYQKKGIKKGDRV